MHFLLGFGSIICSLINPPNHAKSNTTVTKRSAESTKKKHIHNGNIQSRSSINCNDENSVKQSVENLKFSENQNYTVIYVKLEYFPKESVKRVFSSK